MLLLLLLQLLIQSHIRHALCLVLLSQCCSCQIDQLSPPRRCVCACVCSLHGHRYGQHLRHGRTRHYHRRQVLLLIRSHPFESLGIYQQASGRASSTREQATCTNEKPRLTARVSTHLHPIHPSLTHTTQGRKKREKRERKKAREREREREREKRERERQRARERERKRERERGRERESERERERLINRLAHTLNWSIVLHFPNIVFIRFSRSIL